MGKIKHALNLTAFAAGATRPIAGPVKATWEVTYRCNMRCSHCHLWQSDKCDELSTEEAKTFIRDLADLGTIHMSFTGGEPLLRKDILDLVSYARECGLTTGMNTNGSQINSADKARALCEAGLGAAYISLDGANAETHNAIRGRDGAFDSALKAIDYLVEQRPKWKNLVFVNTTITQKNLSQLDAILSLSKEHGVDGMTMSVVQTVDKYSPDSGMMLDNNGLGDLSKRLRELADNSGGLIPHSHGYLNGFQTYLEQPDKLYKYRCVAGTATVLVHPDGEVQPCPASFARMGSLREKPFREIWFSPEANKIRQKIKANQHPICWFDCIAPISVLLHDLRKLRVRNIVDKKTLSHIIKKVSR